MTVQKKTAQNNRAAYCAFESRKSISSELQVVESCVDSVLFHEVVVRTLFNDFSLGNNRNFVGVLYGGKSVGDDKRSPALAKLVKRFLYQYLGGVVKRTRRFVEYEYGRILEEHTCNAESLLLTARKTHASFADLRVVAFFERHYVVVNVGTLCRFDDLFVGCVKLAVEDVFLYACVEKVYVLLYDAYVLSE